MTTAVQFQAQVDKAATNMARLDGVVNGSDTATVVTDGGSVPSLAKVLADLRSTILATIPAGWVTGLKASGLSLNNKGDPGGDLSNVGLFTQQGANIAIPAGVLKVTTAGYSVNGIGIADYVYDASVNAAYVSANPRSSFIEKLGKGFRLDVSCGVSVAQLGANGDGSDQTAALQAALAVSNRVFFPFGQYVVSTALQMAAGQLIYGPNKGHYSDASKRAEIVNNAAGGGCLWYTQDTSASDVRSPCIASLWLTADYPVRLNDETTAQILDSAGNCPPLAYFGVADCDINARVAGVGRGIAVSKGFDGVIAQNRITGFDTGILLNGCDLNVVRDNRIQNSKHYHILELSANTFGSQNEITHNDILYLTDPTGIAIKSTARHTRIYNNYIEQGSNCAVFVDVSAANTPVLVAGQGPGPRLSAVVRDNRIDGHAYATVAAYRLGVQGRHYAEIKDVGTSGPSGGGPGLQFVDDTGAIVGDLPVRYSPTNDLSWEFKGPRFGQWDGFRTDMARSLSITGRNLCQFAGTLARNNAEDYLRLTPGGFVLKSGFTDVLELSSIGFLQANTLYEVEIIASALSGAETLTVGPISGGPVGGGGGGAASGYALSNTPRRIILGLTTGAAGLNDGIYFQRSNNVSGNDITMTVTYRKVADQSLPVTTQDSITYNANSLTGEFLIEAGEASAAGYVRKMYRFMSGRAVLAASDNMFNDPAILDVNITQAGSTISITLSGAASGKNAKVTHNYTRL